MTKKILILAGILSLMAGAAFGHGDENPVAEVVAHYSAIATTLSQDSTDGIAEHAKACMAIMDEHHSEDAHHHGDMEEMHESMHGEDHAMPMDGEKGMMDMKAMHASMRAALKILSDPDVDLAQAREAFKSWSETFVPMAQKMYQARDIDPTWAVMNCPMAKADWIQIDGKVANPYFGSKMPTCGKKVATLGASGHAHEEEHPSSMHSEGHEHGGDGHH